MEKKRFAVDWEFKGDTPPGKRFIGWASTELIDEDGDIIRASAFESTLKNYQTNPLLLWQHNWDEPIGRVVAAQIEPGRGLQIEAELSDTTRGRDAQVLLRDGVLRDLSIGFRTKQFVTTQTGREITEVELYEISLVSIGANREAEVTVLKNLESAERAEVIPADFAVKRLEGLRL